MKISQVNVIKRKTILTATYMDFRTWYQSYCQSERQFEGIYNDNAEFQYVTIKNLSKSQKQEQ